MPAAEVYSSSSPPSASHPLRLWCRLHMQLGTSSPQQALQEQSKQAGPSAPCPLTLVPLGLSCPPLRDGRKGDRRVPAERAARLMSRVWPQPRAWCRNSIADFHRNKSCLSFSAARLEVQLSMGLEFDLGLADQT